MTDPKRPSKDLGAVFDAHVRAEFVDKDVAEPYLTHVPTLAGGTGRKEVESFYRSYFVGHWPDDVEVRTLSRTVGENRVVDELIVSFTHDREIETYLPGVPPTGRKVVLPTSSSWASTTQAANSLPVNAKKTPCSGQERALFGQKSSLFASPRKRLLRRVFQAAFGRSTALGRRASMAISARSLRTATRSRAVSQARASSSV
jgi:hypothetical protein